jgi:1-deoxy-D-xylulose-5-phosphate reductoisomerase
VGALHFESPDLERFPALALARQAGVQGMTYPTVLSAADEVAVEAFLTGRISFLEMAEIVERVLEAHEPVAVTSVEAVFETDRWARRKAEETAGRV